MYHPVKIQTITDGILSGDGDILIDLSIIRMLDADQMLAGRECKGPGKRPYAFVNTVNMDLAPGENLAFQVAKQRIQAHPDEFFLHGVYVDFLGICRVLRMCQRELVIAGEQGYVIVHGGCVYFFRIDVNIRPGRALDE